MILRIILVMTRDYKKNCNVSQLIYKGLIITFLTDKEYKINT